MGRLRTSIWIGRNITMLKIVIREDGSLRLPEPVMGRLSLRAGDGPLLFAPSGAASAAVRRR